MGPTITQGNNNYSKPMSDMVNISAAGLTQATEHKEEYRQLLKKMIGETVRQALDEEMRKATVEMEDEQRKAISELINEQRKLVNKLVEEEKKAIWARAEESRRSALTTG